MRSTLLACLGLFVCAGAASAEGLYAELQFGSSSYQDGDFSAGGQTGQADYHPGFNAGGAVGARLKGELLRLEGAVSYRQSELNEIEGGGVSGAPDLGAVALLGNAYLDVPVPFAVKPYVGGGLGVAIFMLDDLGATQVDSPDARIAGNLMAGVFWPFAHNLELDLRYRWLASDDAQFETSFGPSNDHVEIEFRAHEVVAALRVLF
jgi:opacity protein-like surface antigen